jgi:imidazole glycerol phosphate synthase subunit HisF
MLDAGADKISINSEAVKTRRSFGDPGVRSARNARDAPSTHAGIPDFDTDGTEGWDVLCPRGQDSDG